MSNPGARALLAASSPFTSAALTRFYILAATMQFLQQRKERRCVLAGPAHNQWC